MELKPHRTPPAPVPDERAFFRVVTAGFGQRRKMLSNALAAGLDLPRAVVERACAEAGVDPRARAETLSLAAFAALAQALHPYLRPLP